METVNCYEDTSRANAYATLAFVNTYYLAFRDLPAIITEHVTGTRALDFGCGAGRSTRFLRDLGFDVSGVDIAEDMLKIARATDPAGDYRFAPGGNLDAFTAGTFDLVLSAFPFDNIPGAAKAGILRDLRKLLKPDGTIINLVSAPEIYTNEWASFSTRDFPENAKAKSGDTVRIVVTDYADSRPVDDIFWTDASYRSVFLEADLEVVQMHAPLARDDEPYKWVNETRVSPWAIYVLKR